jgi:tripartite-type tricarboxylate transporter receptor subunit TctC
VKRFLGILAIAMLAIATLAQPAHAQSDFPNRVITIVVPFPAGGALDSVARIMAEKLRTKLGQPVIIENKAGAGGNLGSGHVARSDPDGYTLLFAPQLIFSADMLSDNLNYDPTKLEPVSVLVEYPNVILARADLPVKDFKELLDFIRKNPGKLNYASQGNGQIGHLTIEMMKMMGKLDLVHVPYRGSAPAIADLLAGSTDILADNLVATAGLVKAGKLKMLAVTGAKRIPAYPDVPAVAEFIPGFVSDTWPAIAAPPGTPKEITAKLAAAIGEVIRMPDVLSKLGDAQAEIAKIGPEEMARYIEESRTRWQPVIKASNIKAQ